MTTELKSLSEVELQLHQRVYSRCRSRDETDGKIVEDLIEVSKSGYFKKLGHKSLFIYINLCLDMTKSVSYNFSAVTEKCIEYPLLLKALNSGSVTVSIARKLCPVITADNHHTLIKFACTHSKNETEEEVFRLQEGSGKEQMITLRFSKSEYDVIKRANALRAQNGIIETLNETAIAVCEDYVSRNCPVKKAERAEQRKQKRQQKQTSEAQGEEVATAVVPGQKSGPKSNDISTLWDIGWGPWPTLRIPLTAAQQHTVFLRSQGRCEFHHSNGVRCDCDRFLHIHHIKPVRAGGTNEPENLSLLCSFHHKMVHEGVAHNWPGNFRKINQPAHGHTWAKSESQPPSSVQPETTETTASV